MKRWIWLLVLGFSVALGLSGCPHVTSETAPESTPLATDSTPGQYVIKYYPDVDSETPSSMATAAVTGVKTKIYTVQELGFSKDGYVFEGWRIYREADNQWYVRDDQGKETWLAVENGALPAGFSYAMRKNGSTLTAPATEGTVRLYAQWGGKSFTVVYHPDDNSPALEKTQVITYGESTPMLTLRELGLNRTDASFKGWKLYRELDDRWYLKNAEGKGSWGKLVKGELESGYRFSLSEDGHTLRTATTSGTIHAYAQWSD